LNRTEEAKQLYRKGIELAESTRDAHVKQEMTEELEQLEDEWGEGCKFQDSGFGLRETNTS
jgi:hypothetical protein